MESDQTRATVKAGTRQTTIRVWTELEVEARRLILECISEALERIEMRKEEETVDWLSSVEAGEEFRAEWLDNNLPSGWQSLEDLKAILNNREYT